MKYLYIFLLLSCGLNSFSQIIVKAIICSANGHPLPYTNVASLATNSSISSDKSGRFQLTNLSIDDTLKITNIAYLPRLITVKLLSKADTVFLDDNIKILKEITIRPQKGHESDLGFFKYANNATFMLKPGSQIATLIENTGIGGWIKGVYFKLKAKGKCKNSMRVRFLKVDPENLAPTFDMMNEEVIINADQLKYNNYIDLTHYSIPFPKQGLFVVLEWVYTDFVCDKNSYSVVSANMLVNKDIV